MSNLPSKLTKSALEILEERRKTGAVARPSDEMKAASGAFTKRIALHIDATGSRDKTWDVATGQQVQIIRDLNTLGSFEIGIFVHSGEEASFLGWFTDGTKAEHAMREISCLGGGTKYEKTFGLHSREYRKQKIHAAIMIGDAFEEPNKESMIVSYAQCQVFTLQEGKKYLDEILFGRTAEQAFQYISKKTNGAYAHLGDPEAIRNFVAAIAATVQGSDAVKTLDGGAKAALETLKRSNPRMMLGFDG